MKCLPFNEVYDDLEVRFTSGNDITVERATITNSEWIAIKDELYRLSQKEEKYEKLKELKNG